MCNKTAGHISINVLIVSLASAEFENGSGMNKCANTDNMSDVHCKFKRPGARLTFLGIWWRGDYVIFALSSGIYLNLLNY